MYLLLEGWGLYIYILLAPSRCGYYGGFNAPLGNASSLVMWILMVFQRSAQLAFWLPALFIDRIEWLLYLRQRCSCFVCQGYFVSINDFVQRLDFVSPVSCPRGSMVVVTYHVDHRRWKVFMSCLWPLGFRSILNAQWRCHTHYGHVAHSNMWS